MALKTASYPALRVLEMDIPRSSVTGWANFDLAHGLNTDSVVSVQARASQHGELIDVLWQVKDSNTIQIYTSTDKTGLYVTVLLKV